MLQLLWILLQTFFLFTTDNNCSIEFDDWVIWVDEKPMTAFSIGLDYGLSQGICL
jgi:hypothetical protein